MTSSNGNIFRVTGPLCGEFTGPGEFPAQRPVTRSFDVFFDLRPNKRLSKQSRGWWFETPSWSLWRQCNVGRQHWFSHGLKAFCEAMTCSTTEQTAKLHLSYETHIMSRIIIASVGQLKIKSYGQPWFCEIWVFDVFPISKHSHILQWFV